MINPPPPAELLAELGRFRDRVAALLLDDTAAWQTRPTPDEWSLGEVLCHLRDVEREVHQARIVAVLTEDRAFLQGVNADEWAEPRAYCNQDPPEAQADYLTARDTTIATLRDLPAEAWQRQGQHTFFGPTTLQELVFLIVQHDRVHDKQIAALTEPLDPAG
jgi:hypothetical protein